MEPTKQIIGAQHEFHDEEFVAGWADRFVPTPERLQLFNVILAELESEIPSDGYVVELGVGPGYLAEHLLEAMPGIQYQGIDFSVPMLDIARQRLRRHGARVAWIQADLVKDDWRVHIPMPVHAIVSTWALHDLGSPNNVRAVYKSCAQMLRKEGILLNGDFIKPDNAVHDYEPGRFEIAKHMAMMRDVGFKIAECLVVLEEEIESPSASQNYACFRGVV